MGQARGYLGIVGLDFEDAATPGDDPAVVNQRLLPINSDNVKATRALNTPGTITGRREQVEPFQGNRPIDGTIVVPVDAEAFAYWLVAMFGSPTTSGASDPYTHVFEIENTQPSLVHEQKFADPAAVITYIKQNGLKVGQWSMSVGGDGELVATLTLSGMTQDTPSGVAYDATATTIVLTTRFQQFQAVLKEAGTTIADVLDWNFDINFGLETENYPIGNQGQRSDINEGMVGMSGGGTIMFKDTALLTKAIALTESSFEVIFTSGTHSLTIDFNELVFGESGPEITGPEGVKMTIPWQAYYQNDASDSGVVVTLVNANAGTDYILPNT